MRYEFQKVNHEIQQNILTLLNVYDFRNNQILIPYYYATQYAEFQTLEYRISQPVRSSRY